MPTFDDLVHGQARLAEEDVDWLHLLMADWQLLADLSFADLVLWVPDVEASGWLAVAQMRPTTGPTIYWDDVVGQLVPRGRRPQLDEAYDAGRICRERDPEWHADVPVREETIPVSRDGRTIAVVSRHTNLAAARTPSRLELTYLDCAAQLARMISEGSYPYPGAAPGGALGPRVGDGLLRLDVEGTVTWASPNGLSAYRRLGQAADLVGAHLGTSTAALATSLQPVDEALAVVVSGREPRVVEVEAAGSTVVLRAIPLCPGGVRTGALVLVRDVTELRHRERELVSRDATIREIHHRVKNHLQTVAALLRLQGRRAVEPETRAALEEAVRRVGSIAVVHETLSGGLEQDVDFDVIADRLTASLSDVVAPGGGAVVNRSGSFGRLTPEVATPLALVVNELLANGVEHGLAGRPGTVLLLVHRDESTLRIEVRDDGLGLAPGFSLQTTPTLGLQIVTTLVEGELGGRLGLERGVDGGTVATVTVPLDRAVTAEPA